MKLGIIGLGNMGKAIAEALAASPGENTLFVYDRNPEKAAFVAEHFKGMVCADEKETAQKSEYVLFAVKPINMKEAIAAAQLSEDKILISVAAGVPLDLLAAYCPEVKRIIRVMPNVALTVGQGMSALCASPQVSREQLKQAGDIFKAAGSCIEVEESQMDAVGALSGSSPAYVFMFIESLAQGGILCGMKKDAAYTLAAQSVLGAAKMVLEGGNPAILRDAVTSPGGTTIEGVKALEEGGFRASVINAVKAAFDKTKLLYPLGHNGL